MAQGLVGLWRVAKGSGIGWPHSGAVADVAFLVKFDRMVLQRAFQVTLGLRPFWRYKDDILCIAAKEKVARLRKLFELRAN